MSQLPAVTSFPSVAHLRSLRRSLKEGSFRWESITNAQRWEYHAYDYAFLRVRHGLDNHRYPLDPDGNWFNETMVQAAERIYEPVRRIAEILLAADDPRFPPDLREHFQRQDEERLPLKRQVQVHGERKSDGSPTPEMEAFMACCVRQVAANEKIFAQRSRRAFAPEASMTPQQVRDALGVTATEKKPMHEDPQALRKGRIELGLEAAE